MISNEERILKLEQELKSLRAEYEEYVYIVSHDLGAPIRHIEGFANIISADIYDGLDKKNQDRFDRILSSTDEAKKILKALHEYSRLSSCSSLYEELDCNDIIETITEQLKPLIDESSAELYFSNLPSVYGVPSEISLVFFHLLQNSLLYRADGVKPVIVIECTDNGSQWEFHVKDNGIGVRESLIPKVFKVLRRAVAASQYPGQGMGLAISQKIVEAHGGNIRMESIPENGSRVYFTLPKI